MLKLLGCCLIGAGSVGGAYGICREVADHFRLLYGFRQLFSQLSEEVRYTRCPMEQLLKNASPKDERIARLCMELGDNLSGGDTVSAEEAWRSIFLEKKKELHLSENELEILTEVGSAFFGKCLEENESYFTLAMTRFDFLLDELRKGQKERQKVLQSVVLMGGAVLILLLI